MSDEIGFWDSNTGEIERELSIQTWSTQLVNSHVDGEGDVRVRCDKCGELLYMEKSTHPREFGCGCDEAPHSWLIPVKEDE